MLKRSLLYVFTSLFISLSTMTIAEESNTNSSIDKYNQMMMVFVERLRSGNVKEARKIANDMTSFSKNYKDDAKTEYKNFYSDIEKELYSLKNKDNKKKVVWVNEPIADGYYFLAVIDFQEKQYKDAIENIQKCIFWNPVHSAYYCERGFIFLNSGFDSNIINAQVAYEQALEYANNEEDFASALRGLGFVFTARGQFEESAASMILSKEYDANSTDADAHILYLKRLIPSFDFNMSANEARKILKEAKIQTSFSPDHVNVLIKMANSFTKPEEKERAIIFLRTAQLLDPNNTEVTKKLKALQEK